MPPRRASWLKHFRPKRWLFRPLGTRSKCRWFIGALVGIPLTLFVLSNLGGSRRPGYQSMCFLKAEGLLTFYEDDPPWPPDAEQSGTLYRAGAFTKWGGSHSLFPIRRTLDHTLQVRAEEPPSSRAPSLTQEESNALYAAFAEYLLARGVAKDTAELFRLGPGETTRTDFAASIGLLLGLGVWVGAIYGIGWFFEGMAYELTRRTPLPGVCPRCKYDLTGLPTNTCPECGTGCAPAGQQRP